MSKDEGLVEYFSNCMSHLHILINNKYSCVNHNKDMTPAYPNFGPPQLHPELYDQIEIKLSSPSAKAWLKLG